MSGLSAYWSQATTAIPGLPGGLLAWCLILGFAAVFLAVLALAGASRPDGFRRRLGAPAAPAAPARVVKAGGARMKGPATRRAAMPWRLAFALGPPMAFALAAPAAGWSLTWPELTYGGGILAALGIVVPGRWRAWRSVRHRDALRLGFPDALDMMVLCAEAGLGLDAALNRVAAEIAPAHPALGAELAQIGRELRAGKERGAVLRGFARRAGLPEIESFATLLVQSEALGTGIARTLRVQAEEMRSTRLLRAEERAHTLPVKLTLPLVVCVLPAMIAVVLLPGALTIARDVLPSLGQ